MLLLVYAFNFIDRIMLGILVPPIKHEFALTDTELGLLGGTAFALFYTALGIPIGWLADRLNRVWIVTISLALWSAFTAACGAAKSCAKLCAAPQAAVKALQSASEIVTIHTRFRRSASQPIGIPRAV